MESILHHITSKDISKIEFSGDPKSIENDNEYWLEIKTQGRDKLVEKLQKFSLDSRLLAEVENPAKSNTITATSDAIVLNLVISESDNIYESDYLTILLKPNLLVTIIDEGNNLFKNLEDEINNIPFEVPFNVNNTIYFMINSVQDHSRENILAARMVVDNLARILDEEPEEIEIKDIIQAKVKIHGLANIIEDQYATLQSMPKYDWSETDSKAEDETAKVVKQFNFLYNAVIRLEEKIKELQIQYQLILQEKGNKRLNTLTIIQAIFVPLTLIAGIYGMNFLIMPELAWSNGYFIILGVMVFIAIAELWLFWRNGWFD